ncbi:MAG TPA: fumarylacetoacetate hydrolase family protein [Burkholderiales bacterium]|jgi:fumarylpyruvate hydrolase|nr:fumarylacetoacetate hydrolase family protein [Burkholderiales bacterium]
MNYVIEAPRVAAVPVVGGEATFPVRRIYCVGRNYAAHAREMGHDPEREPPFFFMKPADALVLSGATVPYPPATEDLQHEIELVVALKSGGADIAVEQALDCVYGYGVGLDMTRRDLQGQAKKMGRPWEMGKGFDNSAPITALQPAGQIGHPDKGAIWLKVNGEVKQHGDLNQQIWRVEEQIAYLSRLVRLEAGDMIFTGTPAGVGRVQRGDRLDGHVDGVGDLTVHYGT